MSARTRALGLLVALVAVLAGGLPSADVAQAREVANPRNFTGVITGGQLRIKALTLDLATLDPKITVNGPISANGQISIPATRVGAQNGQNGIYAPDMAFEDYTIRIVPTHAWTGYVNPMTGQMNLRVRFRLELRGGLLGSDGSCKVASDGDPIDINVLQTGSSGKYDASNGTVVITNNTLAINQTASGCGPLGAGNGTVNDTVGLPSGSGNNEARFEMRWSQGGLGDNTFIQKAVNAAFTATPQSGGYAPATVQFNGSGSSTATLTPPATSIASYEWDFGDGTPKVTGASPTTSHVYTSPGTYTARLKVTDNEGSAADSDETTRTITVVNRPPDLTLAKSHLTDLRVGIEGTYRLTVANKNAAVSGPTTGAVTITDTLPAGLAYRGFTGSGWACTSAGQTVTCSNLFAIPLATGTSSSVDLKVMPSPAAYPAVTNTATASTPGEAQPSDNTASDTATVAGADLRLAKSHVGGAFQVGQVRQYNLDVTNRGTGMSLGPITVVDTLPAGLTFDSFAGSGWGCTAAGQTVTCTRNTGIAVDETAQLRLRVLVGGAPRTVTNTATVSNALDVDTTNNDASDQTPIFQTPDLALTTSLAGDLRVDENATYTLAVKNDGTQAANGSVVVTDTLPAGLTFVSATGTGWTCSEASGTVTCTRLAQLAVGASLPDIALTVAVGAAAAPVADETPELANTAELTFTPAAGATADPNADNNRSTATNVVRRVDLTLDKAHTGTFRVGATGTYTLTVRNRGNLAATGTTTVTDELPDGLTFASASGEGWACSGVGQVVTCTRAGAIAASATAPVITLEVGVGAAAAPQTTNVASVSNPADRWPGNDGDSDDTAITQVDLAIVKSAAAGTFRAGQERAYTLKLSNGGIASTGATTVTDTLPTGLQYVSASGSGWDCSFAAPTITCVRAAIVPAASVIPPITVRAKVLPSAAPSVTNVATVATDGDNNLGDNESAVTRAVVAPDLTVAVTGDDELRRRATATYTVDVANQGTDRTPGPVTVTDTLPAGTTFVSATGDGWACTAATGTVTCELPAGLAANADAAPITVRTKIGTGAPDAVTNAVTVSDELDTDTTNNAASVASTVRSVDVALTKTLSGSLKVGGQATYTLAVRNDGDAPTTSALKVTDTVPAGLRITQAFGGAKWDCTTAGQQVTCAYAQPLAAGAANEQPIGIDVEVLPSAIPTGASSASITNAATVNDPLDVDPTDDSDTATGTFGRGPDLAATIARKDGGTSFDAGTDGRYVVALRNVGSAPTTGALTVTAKLGAGLTLKPTPSAGWTCTATGTNVTCTRPHSGGGLAAGAREDLELVVGVSPAAAPTAIVDDVVAGTPGDADASNDEATSSGEFGTPVRTVDVITTLSHSGAFTVGGTGTYTVAVRNGGTLPTRGPIDVALDLGRGAVATSAAGTDWTCVRGGTVRCRYAGTLAPGASAPDIAVNVELGAAASPQTTAVVRTTTPGDAEPSNDTASDLAAIVDTTATALTLGFNDGELGVGTLNLPFGENGVAITIAGRVGSDGTFTVPKAGFTMTPLSLQGIFQATLALQEDAVGTYDRATGAITLRARLGLSVAGGPAPAGCGLGISGTPIVVDLTTGRSGDLSGSPIGTTGDVTLVSKSFAVPASTSCGALDSTLNSLANLPSAAGANKLVLRGRLGSAAPPAPVAAKPSTAASTSTPKAAKKVSILALKSQKALRDGFKLTATPSENGTLKLTTSIKVAGAKKAVKLAAKSVKLRKGKPAIIRLKATSKQLKALKAALKKKRRIDATITAVFTGAGKATEKSTYKVRVTG